MWCPYVLQCATPLVGIALVSHQGTGPVPKSNTSGKVYQWYGFYLSEWTDGDIWATQQTTTP